LSFISLSVCSLGFFGDDGVQPVYGVELPGGHTGVEPFALVFDNGLVVGQFGVIDLNFHDRLRTCALASVLLFVSVIFINDIIELLVRTQILRRVVERIERHVLHIYSFVFLKDRLLRACEL
jgi:hypothetical protein